MATLDGREASSLDLEPARRSVLDREAIDRIYEEFLDKKRAGESPDPGEYLERFPRYRQELVRQFELHTAIEDGMLGKLVSSDAGTDISSGITKSDLPIGGADEPIQCLTLGGFRLRREIGRGAMGIVYEAEQISLRRTVAVKILPALAALDQQKLRRFHNEAKRPHCWIIQASCPCTPWARSTASTTMPCDGSMDRTSHR